MNTEVQRQNNSIPQVLVAEDDVPLGNFLRRQLELESYNVKLVQDGELAADAVARDKYHLLILDLNMPKMDGMEVITQVRPKQPQLPILVLTARTQVEDRVLSLDTGADDCMLKPFSFSELSARVRALLRRNPYLPGTPLQVGDLILDSREYRVERAGKRINLSGKEFALLEYLMRNARQTVTRAMIMEHVWNMPFDNSTNLVDVYVKYASSQADKKKAAVVAASIKGAFQQLGVFTGSATEGIGVPGSPGILRPELTDAPLKLVKVAGSSEKNTGWGGLGVDVDELRRQLEGALGDEIRQHEVQMRVTPEGLVVSLREVGFFNSGQAELLQNGHNTLTRIATILGGRGFEIRVEGHTDNVPVHNSRFKSNWELSTARATAVVSLLIEQHGFDPLLVSAAGYSEYRPVENNSSERGRAANRRVDLVVVGHVPEKDKLAQTDAPPAGQE